MKKEIEASLSLSVRAFVQGMIQGRWERLIQETSLSKEELTEIGDKFHDQQIAFNEWRWMKSKEFADKDMFEAAEKWSTSICRLCEEPLPANGTLVCSCFRNYAIGYVQYEPVDPQLHLAAWINRGGEWDGVSLVGSPEARSYAAKPCYSNECSSCNEPFMVMISELLKVAKLLVEDPSMKGNGSYKIRRICFHCKTRNRAAVKHLVPEQTPQQLHLARQGRG